MKFSTVIIAKNEEARLLDALKSVDFCDDVVVINDASVDRTSEIAKRVGARVFDRKMDGFATQKNFGLDQAKYDWVLVLDADERLSSELQKKIRVLEPEMGTVAYCFAWRNYLGGKWLAHGGLYPDYHTRLFNRKYARYEGREVHEELKIKGEAKTLQGDVTHLTYQGVSDYYAKVMKYAKLEAKWTKKRPSFKSAVKEFLVRYFKQAGWRDGWAGLVSAALLAYYQLVVRWNMNK